MPLLKDRDFVAREQLARQFSSLARRSCSPTLNLQSTPEHPLHLVSPAQ